MTVPAVGGRSAFTLVLAALVCGAASQPSLGALPAVQAQISAASTLSAPSGMRVAGGYGVAARGRSDYATYCVPCHGARGGGDGPLAQMLDPKPARHNDATFMNSLSDEYMFRLLKEGGPALGKSPLMGAWGGSLSEQQIRDLVVFLRSLAEPGN